MLILNEETGKYFLLGHSLQLFHDDASMLVLVNFERVILDLVRIQNILDLHAGSASRVRVKLNLVSSVEALNVLLHNLGGLLKLM